MRKKVNFNTITVKYGEYEETLSHENVILKTKSVSTIKEYDFYTKFLQIKNLIGSTIIDGKPFDIKITNSHIEFLALVMTKDMDFVMHWKNDKELLGSLGGELDRSKESLYKSYTELKRKKYFVTTEDGLVMPNRELNNLRQKVKKDIKTNGHCSFDINFEFCIA